MIENQITQKRYFDQKGTVKEMLFEEGEKVWLQDKFNKTWNVATIVKRLELPRCYLARDEKGKLLRRNIIFLRKRKTLSLEVDVEGDRSKLKAIKRHVVRYQNTRNAKPSKYFFTFLTQFCRSFPF